MIKRKDKLRKHNSLEDSFHAHESLLAKSKRYRPLLKTKTLDDRIDALAGSGFATDSKYGDNIKSIIKGKMFREVLG